MPILLPNLDDRQWQDLVDEGRALIPLYAPEWTDQNVHDPGITFVELFAWLTEMDIFELNRITDRARLKFLRLVGFEPQPPAAATTVLSFSLQGGSTAIDLPAEIVCLGTDPFGVKTPFRTRAPLSVIPSNLVAVQLRDSRGYHNLTDRWQRGQLFGAFGDVPELGAELYLGFDKPLGAGQTLSLYFTFVSPHAKPDERRRILAEAHRRRQTCEPPGMRCGPCGPEWVPASVSSQAGLPRYSGVRLAWEMLIASGSGSAWQPLEPAGVKDDARAFTLDGTVCLKPSTGGTAAILGQVPASLGYVRVRFVAGAYDSPPTIQNLAANAVPAEQAVPVGAVTWTLAPGVAASPPQPPAPQTGSVMQFDAQNQIVSLSFVQDTVVPQFRVLAFVAATTTGPGNLTVEAESAGVGDGTPWQKLQLANAPVQQDSFSLSTLENATWHNWRLRPDLDASTRDSRDYLLDATAGTVMFGDGEKGLTLPAGAQVYVVYRNTRAQNGNLKALAVNQLADSSHNRALIPNLPAVQAQISLRNPVPVSGGAEAETLDHCMGRAIEFLGKPQRAVTLTDCETLAKETPGVDIARATAWANLHPSFQCLKAPGMVTVVVLPNMPVARPTPSPALLSSAATYVNARRIIGSRIEVVGPTYREVAVRAQVQSLPGTAKTLLAQRVADALKAFLDPLSGGPDGTGWPFGRDVYRVEILQVIDHVPGADYVASLALLADGCECTPQCGNICLAPTWLVSSGQHEIEVL